MRGMTSHQINKELLNEPTYLGCYPSNRIPWIRSFPSTIIVNTREHTHPGQHWVAFHFNREYCLYFDSFGFPILEDDIFHTIKNFYPTVIYNQKCIQDITSQSCGKFCIAFVKSVFSLESFDSFINSFNFNRLSLNDNIVLKYM